VTDESAALHGRNRQRATVVLFVVAICAGVVITGGVLQLMS
jgi:hypothetical protein